MTQRLSELASLLQITVTTLLRPAPAAVEAIRANSKRLVTAECKPASAIILIEEINLVFRATRKSNASIVTFGH